MKAFQLIPSIAEYADFGTLASELKLGPADLILTNEYIYNPTIASLDLGCHTCFQEKYGAGEPTDVMVDAILDDLRDKDYDRIVAVGGGTVIDIAKVLTVARPSDKVDDLYDRMASLEKEHPLIIVPTTCGTGSEVTNISIINRTRLGTKMGLVAPALFADQCALIPELLHGLPFEVFAASSIDALVHAVESALSPKATEFSKLLSYKAAEMIIRHYETIAREGREARTAMLGDFLLASNYAGIAFGTAGCAAVHALSYPLGGAYHVPHGESNYAVFTGVMKNYLEIKTDGEISKMMDFIAALLSCEKSRAWDELEKLLDTILPKKPLRAYGVKPEDLPRFTEAVMTTQQRLMNNNFVPLDEARVLKIYKELY